MSAPTGTFGFLAAPARRALDRAGFRSLDDLVGVDERQVASLHGMGPNAMRSLRGALAERGLSFASKI